MTTEAAPGSAQTTPKESPVILPTIGIDQHSFVLQSIMEMQKTLGGLTTMIANLDKSINEQTSTLKTHSRILWASAGALGVVCAVGGFVINQCWPKIVQLMSMDIP